MGWYTPTDNHEWFRKMPKIELHRHLEGSLRYSTLVDVSRTHGITLPIQRDFQRLVQVQLNDPLTFENFLSKFQTLRQFYKSPDVIRRVAREVVEDAAEDNIQYMELRFTPIALSRVEGFPITDVMDWVTESVAEASKVFDVKTNLIVSVNRHESVEAAEEVLKHALDYRDKGVVGVDLAGNEVEFSAIPFQSLFQSMQQEGLFITIHAGEWAGPSNVYEAISELNTDRIGHGVRVIEDEDTVALALERNIPFEVCVTSNVQSGVFSAVKQHAVKKMIDAGLFVTINTDDPGISQITLSDEYQILNREFDLSIERLFFLSNAAIQAAFLPEDQKKDLFEKFKSRFRNWQKK
jgi:adenosine deaminase